MEKYNPSRDWDIKIMKNVFKTKNQSKKNV